MLHIYLYLLAAHFLGAHDNAVNISVIMLTMLLEQVDFPMSGMNKRTVFLFYSKHACENAQETPENIYCWFGFNDHAYWPGNITSPTNMS